MGKSYKKKENPQPGGRPKAFETEEALQEAIDLYFADCKKEKRTPCIAELAYFIGVDRHTVYNYNKDQKFFPIVKKAREYVLAQMENRMINSPTQVTGAIFIAKNYGYRDTQDINHAGSIGLGKQVSEMTEAELKAELEKFEK